MKTRHISEKYKLLNEELHQYNRTFGDSKVSMKWIPMIVDLGYAMKTRTILDYGCGKGNLVQALRAEGFEVDGYDPAVKEWNAYPEVKSDMVICCDVLEHVESRFVGATLDNMKDLSLKVFFTVIALKPSNKTLPNGKNAHITLFSAMKWMRLLTARFPEGERVAWRNKNKLVFKWTKV